MRSRRGRIRKNNMRKQRHVKRPETVFVPSPCASGCHEEYESCHDEVFHEKSNKKTQKKNPSGGFSLKNIFGNILGNSSNDDLLIIVLIVIIFLSRRKTEDNDEQCEESKEFSVSDFMSKASDILNKFNDNDILLIALLYILL